MKRAGVAVVASRPFLSFMDTIEIFSDLLDKMLEFAEEKQNDYGLELAHSEVVLILAILSSLIDNQKLNDCEILPL